MKVLVTGSAGHLGEALASVLAADGFEVVGLDIKASPHTSIVGSIVNRDVVQAGMRGVKAVFHTATLHKPHVATHTHQQFIDTNITGTLNLLQEAVAAGIERFIFTSTTSVFGDALIPPKEEPAAWITEEVKPIPKNIYGVTKAAAEDLCQLYYRNHGLPCMVLRTSRFFPEEDDNKSMRNAYTDDNLKANEFLSRRVDIEDTVSAHVAALNRASAIGFGKYIISATTPFSITDMKALRNHMPDVVKRLVPGYEEEYAKRGWKMFPGIDRVYVNELARQQLGWQPKYDFAAVVERLKHGGTIKSALAHTIGTKGYHNGQVFEEGPFPVN